MVLLGAPNSNGLYSGPSGGLKIETFIILCKACQAKEMASIPPSAFSAGRIRESQRDMKLSNISKTADSSKVFSTSTELNPMKYNSKLMNSIWGFYNRYSPHNVKKVNEARAFVGDLPQSAGSSSNKSEPIISLPSTKLDNVWAILIPQSH